jgi:hypothetical protein
MVKNQPISLYKHGFESYSYSTPFVAQSGNVLPDSKALALLNYGHKSFISLVPEEMPPVVVEDVELTELFLNPFSPSMQAGRNKLVRLSPASFFRLIK